MVEFLVEFLIQNLIYSHGKELHGLGYGSHHSLILCEFRSNILLDIKIYLYFQCKFYIFTIFLWNIHCEYSSLSSSSSTSMACSSPLPSPTGSYGAVALAIDRTTGKRVAIKRIKNLFDLYENAKRILREIKILRYVWHAYIGIHNMGSPGCCCWWFEFHGLHY